jgi:twitching motility two-component system response regulator PilH
MDPNAAPAEYANFLSKISTFVSLDVVDSTSLKAGESDQDVIYTFLSYHKMIRELVYAHHGEIATISGDGIMCRFERADDAAAAIEHLLQMIPDFNKRQNRLSLPFNLRVGANTGQVYEGQGLTPGQLISHTIDVAAKLQQACPPNQALMSQETFDQLKQTRLPLTRLGWDAKLKTTAYQYAGTRQAQSAPRALPKPVKILVVEDDLPELIRLKKVLWARHHDPLPVYTSAQAALCTSAWRPHVIMLSAELPWDTGWQLLKALRSDPKASSIPVIVMSQQSTGETVEKCFGLGANGFLRKPFEEQHIVKRVDMVLREFYL